MCFPLCHYNATCGQFLHIAPFNLLVPGVHQALEQHVIVYNPLAWNTTTIINFTVTFPTAAVFNDDGQPVPAQVVRFYRSYLKEHYVRNRLVYVFQEYLPSLGC